ncbi:PaREP1 family protein [Vulcanisaeta sp. JCM 14467]|uniref:PaREP1 family protein n=1 Tax=Vulcanisaeta sp. JCM 14467 TaxID=1295370 RepID=UPI000AC841AC|nr:PaREP1 family protein [Vulcanisaeta sp. JCM 14467]
MQASEKLYKAAKECVKGLAQHYNLEDVLFKVNERGRWTVTELEKAVEKISEKLGEWFVTAWDKAWVLHAWGLHEEKLDSNAVSVRLPLY